MRAKPRRKVHANGRNEGRFFTVPHHLYKSDAYQSLSARAKCIFMEFMYRYNGYNNGEIHLSVRAAMKISGSGSATANKALKELESHGLIATVEKGMFTYAHCGATTYRLTHLHSDLGNGSPPTNEWKHYKCIPPKKKTLPKKSL